MRAPTHFHSWMVCSNFGFHLEATMFIENCLCPIEIFKFISTDQNIIFSYLHSVVLSPFSNLMYNLCFPFLFFFLEKNFKRHVLVLLAISYNVFEIISSNGLLLANSQFIFSSLLIPLSYWLLS